MNQKMEKRKGLVATLLAFALIIGITILTQSYKELFVSATGNLKIFGNLGVILGVGMLLKYKYTREILGIISLLGILGTSILLMVAESVYVLPNFILLISLVGLFYILMISKSVKEYIGN